MRAIAETSVAPPAEVACAHCDLPVPTGLQAPEESRQFCCTGCRAAWTILHDAGLTGYYEFSERRPHAVLSTHREYAELDHPAFRDLYIRPAAHGLLETELYLEGVHCASCVWLVERLPIAVPGAARAELDVGRSMARLQWDPALTTLSTIARFLDRLGYRPHPFRGGERERLRRAEDRVMLGRIGIAGALAGNVMMVALALYAGWFGDMEPEQVRYFRWVSLGLTAPVLLWPGRSFFQSAWGGLRLRRLHMDVPVALALAAGFLRGAYNTISDRGPVYFDGVAMLVFLLLVGRYLQQRAQRASASSAELLYGLAPSTARLVQADTIRDVPTEALVPGMVVEVRGGDTIPADGVVTEGESAVDLSLLTGESRPERIAPGADVFAGTVNRTATIRVRTTLAGEASRLGRMLADVEAGASRRAPVARLADRVAGWFVGVVLVLAVITWLIWRPVDADLALDHAIALLIVTCPCALALATPLSMTAAIGQAAGRGILIRGADVLESLARPARLFLDKTGTLTLGSLALVHWEGNDGLRRAVLALERHSSHPLADAFRAAWPGHRLPEATAVEHLPGGGLSGRVSGLHVVVGSPAYVNAAATDPLRLGARVPGHLTPVLVAVDGRVVAAAGFGDRVRDESRSTLDRLRAKGWRVGMLSGDAAGVVAAVARELHIPADAAVAGATPEAKRRAVEGALREGPVVMVGDGVNDAAAIARATVGIGVHGGAEASLAAADVYLARPGLGPLAELVDGAERTMRIIRRNIAFSLGYNVVGATLAVAGLLDPLIAAVLMPASSVTVMLVAWRSRTFGGPR